MRKQRAKPRGTSQSLAQLNRPAACLVDSAGDLYIADTYNHRICKVDTNGTIATVAGVGVAGNGGDEGPATSASLNAPLGVTADDNGNIYISDFLDNRIRIVMANSTAVSLPTTSLGASSAVEDVSLSTTASETIASITVPASQGGNFEYTLGTVTGCTLGSSNPSGTICSLPPTTRKTSSTPHPIGAR